MKILGHRACLRVSRLLRWGIFDWLHFKNSNHLHIQNYVLVTCKTQSFILKVKVHLLA